MPRSLTTIRRHRRERGSVMVITAAMIMVLLGFLALSMDMGYVLSGRTQLQNGIDAATRAAAAGLQVAIEPGAGYSHQDPEVIRKLAKQYAGLNTVRRYPALPTTDTAHYPEGLKEDPNNAISLSDDDIQIRHDLQPPRVIIKHRLDQNPLSAPDGETTSGYDARRRKGKIPTIFAGIFSIKAIGVDLDSIGIGASAVAAVVPVEGGTGMISGGWRPLLLPDTYFDATGQVWAYMSNPQITASGNYYRFPQTGDNYRSRFAGSTYSSSPFVENSGAVVTSIRDAKSTSELRVNGGYNLIAQPITIKRGDWRVVDFSTSYPGTVIPGITPGLQISGGYNGYVQVGKDITVYPTSDSVYTSVVTKLQEYLNNYLADTFDQTKLNTYGYVSSDFYPTANTHPQIIPVLLCSPIDLATNSGKTQYKVTNFGAFFLQAVSTNGDLTGYFVREVVVGGVLLQSNVTDSKLLPVSVRVMQ